MRSVLAVSLGLVCLLCAARDVRGQEWPAWAKEFPDKAVEAKVGDKVWATVPAGVGDMARVAVFKVSAVDGNHATLADPMGRKFEGVPGALIHPLLDRSEVQEGDVVHGYEWSLGSIVCRVTKLGKQAAMEHWWFDKVTEGKLDDVEPLRVGAEPMAWVSYPHGGRPFKGYCIALEGDRAWILEDAGQVVEVEKEAIAPLAIGGKDFEAGDKVQAYSWGFGYLPATVESVVEPGLAYRIKLDGEEDEAKAYYFADLLPAP